MGSKAVLAIIDYEDDYVQPLLLKVIKLKLPSCNLITNPGSDSWPEDDLVLYWRQYEAIDFSHLMQHPQYAQANSYVIRKALIRKHYLANTVTHWLSKHPESILRSHVKSSIDFEVDYAEFLDDALLEAYELHESWQRNSALEDKQKEWWILKPGMSDKGQGIRLFSSEEELTAIFEAWDPESDEEDEAIEQSDGDEAERRLDTGIRTSHLRHFIVQPYVDPPLLLPDPHASAGKKFHIRTYVLAVGALKVYVYKPMLALFAAQSYRKPSQQSANDTLDAHLTNTCLQSSGDRDGAIHAFWSLPSNLLSLPKDLQFSWQEAVWQQICTVTAEAFEAAARVSSIHFQPLPNAFEIFGLDFLVDAQGCAWLLEVNAFPDFKQTGEELSGMIERLFEGVVEKAVMPFFKMEAPGSAAADELVEVLDIDLGRH